MMGTLVVKRLIWMFAGKALIFEVHKIIHKTLKVIFNTYGISYDELLVLNDDFLIHQKKLQFLVTEVLKVYK